jgi:hypothetical protein
VLVIINDWRKCSGMIGKVKQKVFHNSQNPSWLVEFPDNSSSWFTTMELIRVNK